MLELEKLTRRFGERVAVADATLAIPAGQMVGIIGRSGAGNGALNVKANGVGPLASSEANRSLASSTVGMCPTGIHHSANTI